MFLVLVPCDNQILSFRLTNLNNLPFHIRVILLVHLGVGPCLTWFRVNHIHSTSTLRVVDGLWSEFDENITEKVPRCLVAEI